MLHWVWHNNSPLFIYLKNVFFLLKIKKILYTSLWMDMVTSYSNFSFFYLGKFHPQSKDSNINCMCNVWAQRLQWLLGHNQAKQIERGPWPILFAAKWSVQNWGTGHIQFNMINSLKWEWHFRKYFTISICTLWYIYYLHHNLSKNDKISFFTQCDLIWMTLWPNANLTVTCSYF